MSTYVDDTYLNSARLRSAEHFANADRTLGTVLDERGRERGLSAGTRESSSELVEHSLRATNTRGSPPSFFPPIRAVDAREWDGGCWMLEHLVRKTAATRDFFLDVASTPIPLATVLCESLKERPLPGDGRSFVLPVLRVIFVLPSAARECLILLKIGNQ